jgi:hypothetical protein
VQFGVLVDRRVDALEQTGSFEIGKMVLEIEARSPPRRTRAASFVGLVEHCEILSADAPTVSHWLRDGQSAQSLDEFSAKD